MSANHSPENEVPTSSPRETQTGTRLIGTRACLRCHHELDGQPIIRIEPEGLLVARCPECGRASPVLEYPVLGHWGSRLGVGLLLLYIVIAVAAVLSVAATCFGIALQITESSYRGLRTLIQSKWDVASRESAFDTSNTWEANLAWWHERGPGIIAEFEATQGLGFSSLPILEMGGFALLAALFGVIWAGLFAGVRRSRLWILPIVSYLITIGLAILMTRLGDGPLVPIYWIADSVRVRSLVPFTLLAGTVGLEIGILMGRPVLRMLTRLLLPPNRQSDVDFLWRVDRKR